MTELIPAEKIPMKFIDSLMEGITGVAPTTIDISKGIGEVPGGAEDVGLYVFFLEGEKKIPIYVGVTDDQKGFKGRFEGHKALGKIDDPSQFKYPRKDYSLRVLLVKTEVFCQALLLESMLLFAFDFCLNLLQNGKTQARNPVLDIKQLTPKETGHKFKDNTAQITSACVDVFRAIESTTRSTSARGTRPPSRASSSGAASSGANAAKTAPVQKTIKKKPAATKKPAAAKDADFWASDQQRPESAASVASKLSEMTVGSSSKNRFSRNKK